MKKPGVTNSKKGAIFNILWLLVDNPQKLEFFRIIDIQQQLMDEFQISLDRKTVIDYLDILMQLNLEIEISHIRNKGYFVSKRFISDSERRIIIDLLLEQKSLDDRVKRNLFNYMTMDLPLNSRNFFKFNLDDDKEFDMLRNLEIINRAIVEKKNIIFNFLNFDRFGKLINNSREYNVFPQAIKYVNGIYLMYCNEKVWGADYCGIRIKYMRNIRIGDMSSANLPINPKINYTIELDVIYEWSIECIEPYFDNYKIINTKNGIKAIITAPYDFISSWYKSHGFFFKINDDNLKTTIITELNQIIENFNYSNDIVSRIKSSIVDFHYHNPINELNDREGYLKRLENYIDFGLSCVGFNLILKDKSKIYSNNDKKIVIRYYFHTEDDKLIEELKQLLNEEVSEKYFIIFYNELSDFAYNQIVELTNNDLFLNEYDKFSHNNINYFYNFSVVKIK